MRNEQQGLSAIGWLFILALIAAVGMMVLRLTPVYIEHFGVSGSLNSLKDDPAAPASVPELRQSLMRRLDINNVDSIDPEDIAISREERGYLVSIDYEVRVPFLWNVDLIAHFHDEAEVSAR